MSGLDVKLVKITSHFFMANRLTLMSIYWSEEIDSYIDNDSTFYHKVSSREIAIICVTSAALLLAQRTQRFK